MLKKTTIAAGTLAAAILAFQPAAEAGKAKFSLSIGSGHWHHGYHDPYYDPYYAPAHYGYYVMPRWKVYRKLNRRGFHGFHRTWRKGPYYRLRAYRNGRLFKIKVDARSGRIVWKRRIG